MSNFDNLTSKILNDAKEKAADIVKKAQVTADEKYKLEMKKVDSKKEIIIESAVRERELLTERIQSNARLKVRNEKLKSKQVVIDKVIDKLKEKLVNMNEE